MPEPKLVFDSVHLSDLTVSQYRNLLDLAGLAITRTTVDALFPTLALRLQQAMGFDLLTLGLYESSTESVRLNLWNAGQTLSRSESLPVHSCANGWAWKTQRSVLVQDLAAEHRLPTSLECLRQQGIRSYYVFPLTTVHRRLGALGFGSLQVVSDRQEKIEFLHRITALIAPRLESEFAAGPGPEADYFQNPPAVTARPQPEGRPFDLRDQAGEGEAFHGIVGNSAPLQELLRQVGTVADTNATVLLVGGTGTGKELVARAIHQLSSRANRKFVSVNCTAIPTELLESELFGHEKGAFTGAIDRRVGRLELADGGTLLLDEVGDLPIVIQPKLLRVLQDKQFERLGSNRTITADVRLIAATNQDLRRSIAEGRFREDLFYRLNVFPILVPSLQERKSDIPALVRHFVSRYANDAKKSIATIPADAMHALLNWSWPGNIRELQNLLQRCVILTDSPVLNVPLDQLKKGTTPSSGKMSPEVEREVILQALKEAGGLIGGPSGAANRLGMKRTTLYSKMKKLHIRPAEFQD